MQCDISGEPHTYLQPYLQRMTLQRQTQLLSLLSWGLHSRSDIDLCWYFAPVGGGWPAQRQRSSLESCPPSGDSGRHIRIRMPGSRERWLQWTSLLSDDPMFQPFPFWVVSGYPSLETCFFFWEDRGGGGQSWTPQRRLLHRVPPQRKEWVKANISVVCCVQERRVHENTLLAFPSETSAETSALQNLTSIHTHLKFSLTHYTVAKTSATNVLVAEGLKPSS